MKKLTIRNWAEEDRPREKMLHKGVTALSDAELIAILISTGNSKESAVQLSQRILFSVKNNLNELGKTSVKDLVRNFHGIGEAKAISILAALELGKRRGSSEVLQRKKITCSRDGFLLFHPFLADLPHEELWVAFTNQAGKVLDRMKISQGGVSATAADIRLILRSALDVLATGIFLCHNHPSGNLSPSREDDVLTERLKQSAALMNISLLDHIILTDTTYFSYADEARIL
ncbi:MAG: DNA repair protein RadC [Tannerellaceae bacterium]|nr:DNA repair protein RadC [Tannerellaceae bacterium]